MKSEYDIFVVGGGAAGLTAAGYAARAGYSVLLADAAAPGGQLMFIADIENYPGYQHISGMELADKMENQARDFGVEVEYTEVNKIEKQGKTFILSTIDGTVKAKSVILSMGAKHRHLGVEGEEKYEGRGVSYCATCDGPFFKGKKIAVVGGGDTALTDALYLSKLASEVTIIHRREEFRAQKVLQDRVRSTANINFKLSHTVKEIKGDGTKVTGVLLDDDSLLSCDAIFIFAGILPSTDIVKDTVKLDEKNFIITDMNMQTSVEGIFAAGDTRNTPFRQVITACGDGAIAAHSADEYISSL